MNLAGKCCIPKSCVVVNSNKDVDSSDDTAIEMINKKISTLANNQGSNNNDNYNLDCFAGRGALTLKVNKEILWR